MRNKNIYGDNITVNYDFCRKLEIFWYQLIQRNTLLQLLNFILQNIENTTTSPYPFLIKNKNCGVCKRRRGCQCLIVINLTQ